METEMVNELEDGTEQSSMRDQGSASAFAAIFAWHWIMFLMLSA